MRKLLLLASLSGLAACSETPLEDGSEEAVIAIEKQIEGDAKSLEEAAEEAVKVLETEIEEELDSDGFPRPVATTPRPAQDQQ